MVCPVCRTECHDSVCPECGFSKTSMAQIQFHEMEDWFSNVIQPYREEYWHKKKAQFKIEKNVLIKYEGSNSIVDIPYGVTEIGEYAFCEKDNIVKINVPSSVRILQEYAFSCCYNVECITFCEGLRSIHHGAFECCDKLSIMLPNSVDYIEAGFCCSGTKITVHSDNSRYAVVDSFFIDVKNSVLLHCWSDKLSIKVPNTVKQIGSWAFPETDNHNRRIIIPEGVIGINGVLGSGILRVKLPASLKYIEPGALREVSIILISEDNPYFDSSNCLLVEKATDTLITPRRKNLSRINLTPGIKRIAKYAFSNCPNLDKVIIPESVEFIDHSGFYCCKSLKSIFYESEDISANWSYWWRHDLSILVYWKGQWGFEPVPKKP